MSSSIVKTIHEWLIREGFTLVDDGKRRKHYKYTDGRVTVVTSRSPSCPFVFKKVQADVRRAGARLIS